MKKLKLALSADTRARRRRRFSVHIPRSITASAWTRTLGALLVATSLLTLAAYFYDYGRLQLAPPGLLYRQTQSALVRPPRPRVAQFEGVRYDESGVGVEFFGGIRYAMPPLGERRFALPVPAPFSDDGEGAVVDAGGWGKRCMQTPSSQRPLSDMSEDCLTVNVFRPAKRPATPLPVMIWIYGGGFQSGSSSMYNATALVRRSIELGTPMMVLSFNYRLGPWAQPGNLGLADQALAVKWARRHLPTFGGDVGRTTVAGQSAGAISVWHLVANAGADGVWWRGVIAQSGALDTLPYFHPRVRARNFERFAAAAGCMINAHRKTSGALACLRGVRDPRTLLDAHRVAMDAAMGAMGAGGSVGAYEQFPWAPSAPVAGASVDALEARVVGVGAGLRVLLGANADEGAQFVPGGGLGGLLARTLNSTARAARFGPHPDADAARVLGDVLFHAPVRALARRLSAASTSTAARVWYYHFTAASGHGAELPALFDAPASTGLADRWIAFVVDGSPGDDWAPFPAAFELSATQPHAVPLWRVEEIQAAEDVLREMRAEWPWASLP